MRVQSDFYPGRFEATLPRYAAIRKSARARGNRIHDAWGAYGAARSLIPLGRLDEAIDHFNIAIRLSPDHARAHNNLGTALAKKKKLSSAAIEFAIAVKLDPNYPEAEYNLATAYLKEKHYDDAVKTYRSLLKKHPEYTPAQNGLAQAAQLAGSPR